MTSASYGKKVMADELRVLIVDDNAACRTYMSGIVRSIKDTQVVATAPNGRLAMARLKQMPVDVVLLDFDMPEMDGLETLSHIQASHAEVGVVMVTDDYSAHADKVVQALQGGAIECVSKTDSLCVENGSQELRLRLVTLLGLVRSRRDTQAVRHLTHSGSSLSEIGEHSEPEPVLAEKATRSTLSEDLPSPSTISRVPARVEVVAIGVSTGGPNALTKLVPKLPGDLGVPVVLVQHMPEDITVSLAASLSKKSSLNVREGADGDELRPNVVYLAPGGKHMVVEQDQRGDSLVSRHIRLNNAPPENSCRPSVDVLFRSLAKAFDGDILAVIMTGMGSDGVKGVQTMKQKRCYCLTQTEKTCVVYGMPRSIDEANLSDEKVDLEYLAERIVTLVNGTGRGLR